ncbi:MAG TPA: TetR/AcrR family transcriptional regulator [Polyangiaceae bacterium]|nr:TetR/AcrR family transcriptional regulator [Polyangiaceae bacterium]
MSRVSRVKDERLQRVRRAALEAFLRHGYRKVTMDDIARAVGISRPALYLVYPNKEAVFRAVVEAGLDELIARIERGLPDRTTAAEQLLFVFGESSVRSFELVARAPAAAELLHASFDFVRDLFEQHERRLAGIVARILRAAAADPGAMRPSAEARARILIAAAHGFKATAKSGRELRALFGELVELSLAPTRAPCAQDPPRRRRSASSKRGANRG